MTNIQLGLGLIGIGRCWGYKLSTVPSETDVMEFLNEALKAGIKFFDTAPAYGLSEARLGKFLKTISKEQRANIIIATKCGEFYDEKTGSTYIDHSYTALCDSISRSLKLLGKIDILQLHKTNLDILKSDVLLDVIKYAKQKGIENFGASVSDKTSGQMVCENRLFSSIQLPYNMSSNYMEEVLDSAIKNDKFVIINRPLNMGEIMYKGDVSEKTISEAFGYIMRKKFKGTILTGTKTVEHLQENIKEFQKVLEE